MSSFDLLEHHRRRTRQAEGRANALETQLAKALRLIGLAVQVAAGDECEPIALLQVLEQLDERAQNRGASIDDLAAILRATDPVRVAA